MTELNRNFRYFNSNFPDSIISSMLIAGGGSELLNFSGLLEKATSLPVRNFSYIREIGIGRDISDTDKLLKDASLLAQSVALAMDDTNELNILPVSYRNTKTKNMTVLGLSFLSFIAVAMITYFSFGITERLNETEQMLSEIRSERSLLSPVQADYQRLVDEKAGLENVSRYIDQEMNAASGYDRTDRILKVLSTVSYPGIVIDNINIIGRRYENVYDSMTATTIYAERRISMTCRATADDIEQSVLSFMLYLKGLPYFSRIDFTKIPVPGGFDARSFEISMYIQPWGQ
ncbi:hypothetical protein ACFL4Q_01765 [candidate division KSB1 bacterium]